MGVPKQRGAGQRGGAGGQRANRGTFRNSGGVVKPPSKSCAVLALALATGALTPVIATVGLIVQNT